MLNDTTTPKKQRNPVLYTPEPLDRGKEASYYQDREKASLALL
jgi:hypothetical protein